MQKESNDIIKRIGKVEVGQVALTKAYALPAKWVIHAVAPDGNVTTDSAMFDHLLKQTYHNVIKRAVDRRAKTIALPLLCSGMLLAYCVYGCAVSTAHSLRTMIASVDTSVSENFVKNDDYFIIPLAHYPLLCLLGALRQP